MFDFIRPLLVYKKYLIAHKILRLIGNYTVWLSEPRQKDEPIEQVYKISFGRWSITEIIGRFSIIPPIRLLESIDLLFKNEHITRIENHDLNKYAIFCNKEGERALNNGFYIRKVYLFWIRIIGIPSGTIGIITLLSKLLG